MEREQKKVESDICCICGDKVSSVYSYCDRLEDGNVRMYLGHKRCIVYVPSELEKGIKLNHTEIEVKELN